MPVTITKPQATLRELLAGLKKRTGLFGEQVMRANTIDEYYNVTGTNRNLIINGDFRISQRGTYTSATALTGSNTYYLDRFKLFESAASSSTFQHKLDQKLADGSYANTLHIIATAANSIPVLQYFVEEHKAVWGKTFTISFWYKSNKAWSYNIYNGTTQWHYQVPSSNDVWTKYSQTITLPENGTTLRFELYRYGAPGSLVSGDYFEFTKMQLELGSVASPFEIRPYATELALCQRYCQVLGGASTNEVMASGSGNVTNLSTQVYKPCVPFRTIPTLAYSALGHFEIQAVGTNVYTPTGISLISSISSTQYIYIDINHTSGGTTGAVQLLRAANTNARLTFSAEL